MTGNYRLDPEPIAQGGQGTVHYGTAPDGRRVAVKIAAPGGPPAKALLREMELLRHMNGAGVAGVVPILDSFRVDERPAMVMPLYPDHLGNWLKRTILEPGPTTLTDVLTTHVRLARIVASVHKVHYEGGTVVHRDIKPENIFLSADGELFLGDFGGAMAVERLRAVELAMFGTPMWAPLDQLLPGRAMPDPTWDTYATCVVLYAAITGARPAYQADPRELLTPAGQALWSAARDAVEAKGDDRKAAQQRFGVMRKGTTAADLVDLTGRAALVSGDRAAIEAGVARLSKLAGLDKDARKQLERGLWNLLVRGLSPLSHPSPPNRYRDGDELADAIEDLTRLLPSHSKIGSLSSLMQGDDEPADVFQVDEDTPHKTSLQEGQPVVLGAVLLMVALFVLGGVVFAWPTLTKAFVATRPLPDRVEIPGGTVALSAGTAAVPAFTLDTTEVSRSDYAQCSACPPLEDEAPETAPAHPLTWAAAEAVCAHRGGRVPSESQWSLAHGSSTYPWGEQPPNCDRARGAGCDPVPVLVGAARQGASKDGAVDLAGNVWEWVMGIDGEPVLLGGSVTSPPRELGKGGRREAPADTAPKYAGVRCAYPASTP